MVRKFLLFTLCAAALSAFILGLAACAPRHTEGLSYKLNSEMNGYEVTGMGTATSSELIIPDTYNGLPVSAVASEAFKGYTAITKVTFPESLTHIGSRAFAGCTGITEVSIPESVAYIDSYAFANCSGIHELTIPASVTKLGAGVLSGCSNLNTLTIPFVGESRTPRPPEESSWYDSPSPYNMIGYLFSSVSYGRNEIPSSLKNIVLTDCTVIPEYAFIGCDTLRTITLPASLKTIEEKAFLDESNSGFTCSSLIEICNDSPLLIQAGSKNHGGIGYYAKHVYRPDIGESLIAQAGDYVIFNNSPTPYLIEYLGDDTSVTLPDAIDGKNYEIYRSAFSGNETIESCVIPNSVITIGENAFADCTKLRDITLGNAVTFIENDAFQNCNDLAGVYIDDLTAWCNIDFKNSAANPLSHAAGLYLNGNLVQDLTTPNGITEIKPYTFYGCSVQSVTLPDSVVTIGAYSFSDCTRLKNVDFGDCVTSIGAGAFYCCTNLTNVELGNSVTSIGTGAFGVCTNLTNVEFGDSMTSIGEYAFAYCTNLKNVGFSNSLTSIGEYAFALCSFSEIIIPDSVTKIGQYAFDDNDSLTAIYYCGSYEEFTENDLDWNLDGIDPNILRVYSADPPAWLPDPEGWSYFWHYVDGVPTLWEYTATSNEIIQAS